MVMVAKYHYQDRGQGESLQKIAFNRHHTRLTHHQKACYYATVSFIFGQFKLIISGYLFVCSCSISHDSCIEPAFEVGPKLHKIDVMIDVALKGQGLTYHLILKLLQDSKIPEVTFQFL